MTSTNPSDVSKLTVPQLKALCKEKRITGYSKLGKAALLQRLAEFEASLPKPTPQSKGQDNANTTTSAVPSPSLCAERARDTAVPPVEPSAPPFQRSTTTGDVARLEQRVRGEASAPTESPAILETSARPCSSAGPPKSIQNKTVTSTIQEPPALTKTKRPAHIDPSAPQKRARISLKPTTTRDHEPSAPQTRTLQKKSPLASSVPRVPQSLPRSTAAAISKSSVPVESSTTNSRPSQKVAPRPPGSGRFKPLAVSMPKGVESVQMSRTAAKPVVTRGDAISSVFDFPAMAAPELIHISHPPRVSERKWVYRWAVILSALSPEDRRTCGPVSRTFRYAVYLSAAHILKWKFAGRRLDAIFQKYPENMTNFWPYLRFRMAEVSKRQRIFKQSFLGRYTSSLGYDPLSEHLWTSPDDEKQVNIALRFVLTRMWFAVSVGAYGHDPSTWTKSIIKDVREIVKGEIWQVIAQREGISEAFYMLEATCEVIGQPPSSEGKTTQGYHLRADWNAWILQRSQCPPSLDTGPCSLLDYVKWSNTEDYDRGISKAWSRRVSGQDAESVARRLVAERYLLACVVANGISGQWMSTSAMAQDFAGLPERGGLIPRTAARSVNMYIPAHHLIEGVHFKTSRGEALHPAIAVIQTPTREYYILRDNGMQIGCEEEGIPMIWQDILHCDTVGM